MFVISLSSKKVKLCLIVAVVVLGVISCSAVVLYNCNSQKGSEENTILSVNNNVSDTEQVLRFISSFGWEVDSEPDEIREIIIPAEFDEVYESYNELQLSQGYDLSAYAGERAKNWSFTVLNYPGYENEEFIKINILICDNKVIGGDVCSVKLDGFMHGFMKE